MSEQMSISFQQVHEYNSSFGQPIVFLGTNTISSSLNCFLTDKLEPPLSLSECRVTKYSQKAYIPKSEFYDYWRELTLN